MGRFATYTALVAAGLLGLSTAPAAAARPVIERASYVDRFADDLFLDLCGIRTMTTLTERWSLKRYRDGSEVLHVVRTFVPDDRRLPIEKGAGTTFTAPDGSRTTVGKPIHLIARDGGTTILDAGRVMFDAEGNVTSVRGPHPALDADLAEFYCP